LLHSTSNKCSKKRHTGEESPSPPLQAPPSVTVQRDRLLVNASSSDHIATHSFTQSEGCCSAVVFNRSARDPQALWMSAMSVNTHFKCMGRDIMTNNDTYLYLHLHLGHLADAFIQSDLQRVHLLKETVSSIHSCEANRTSFVIGSICPHVGPEARPVENHWCTSQIGPATTTNFLGSSCVSE